MSERDYLIAKAEREVKRKEDDRYRTGEGLVIRRGGELKARVLHPLTLPGAAASIASAGYAGHHGGKWLAKNPSKKMPGKVKLGLAGAAAGTVAQQIGMHRGGNKWRREQGLPERSAWGGFKVER